MRNTEIEHELIRKELVDTAGTQTDEVILCSCGAVETIVPQDEDINSLDARHFLTNDIWPFKQKKKYKWPNNTPEDDEAERRRNTDDN